MAQPPAQVTLPVVGNVTALKVCETTGQKKLPHVAGPCKAVLFVSSSRRPQQCVAAIPASVDSTGRISVAFGVYTAELLAELLGEGEAEVGSAKLELRMAPAAQAEQQLPVLKFINRGLAAQQAAAGGSTSSTSSTSSSLAGGAHAGCPRPQLLAGHLLVLLGDGYPVKGAEPLCSSGDDGGGDTMTFTLPQLPQVRLGVLLAPVEACLLPCDGAALTLDLLPAPCLLQGEWPIEMTVAAQGSSSKGLQFSGMHLGREQALHLPQQGNFFYLPTSVQRGGVCSSLASLGLLLPGTISLEQQCRVVSLHGFARLLHWLSDLAGAGRTSRLQPGQHADNSQQQQARHPQAAASSSQGSAEELAAAQIEQQLSAARLQHSSSLRGEEGRQLLRSTALGSTQLSRTAVPSPSPALLTCRLASKPDETPRVISVELCTNVLLSRVASSRGGWQALHPTALALAALPLELAQAPLLAAN
jgi:hypothetical protein